MKTSKILMAMALPVVFAACTSEDVVESTQNNALENRKVLGDIEIVMGDVDSRFAREEGGWSYEAGDAFGAALVDVPNGQKNEEAYKNYNLSQYIQTNYQYAKGEGDTWTTPARMVEGNYVFYAPFNPNHLTRTAMEVAFPIAQTLDVENGEVLPYSTINNALDEGYPFFVDYKFLSAEDQETSVELKFKHIYAYPEIKFVNETDESITLEKFVVALNKTFPVKGTLNLTGTNTGVAKAGDGVVGKLFNLGTELTDKNTSNTKAVTWGDWVKYNVKKYGAGSTSEVVTAVGASRTTHIVIDIPETLTVAAGEEVLFHVVVPAGSYNFDVYAMVNAEKGYHAYMSGQFYPGKRYPKNAYKQDGDLKSNPNKDFTFTIDEDEKATVQSGANAPVVVTTTGELIEAIDNADASTLNVITDGDVSFNQSVVDALEDSEVTNLLKINGDITVEGSSDSTKPLTLTDLIAIDGIATIKSGYVSTAISLNEAVVAKDATLTVAGDVTKLTNNGTVNVAKGAAIAASTNKNIMNITDADATVVVTNEKTLNINKAAALTIDNYKKKDTNAGIAGYKGDVYVACDYTTSHLNGDWTVNSGTLTVSADVTIAQEVEVKADAYLVGKKMTINGGASLTVSGRVDGEVILNGTPEDDDTTDTELAIATFELKKDSYINATVSAKNTDEEYFTCNLFKIADDVEFLNTYTAKDYIKSQYVYTGTITGDAEEDPEIPTECNALSLTGSIKAVDAKTILWNDSQLIDIVISGGILANNGWVSLPEDCKNISVAGSVEVFKGAVNFRDANVTIGGKMVVKVADGVKSTGKLTVAKDIIYHENSITNTLPVIVAKGSNFTVAEGKQVCVGTLHVEGNMSVAGQGALLADWIYVYQNKTLTISTEGTVNANGSNGVGFVSSYAVDHSTAEPASTTNLVRGKVVNNGTVASAKSTYKEGTTYPWWFGEDATVVVP